ncbi:MAG: 50S ribosomal protein L32e [Candidatus Woesearchaeota archaeon]
MTDKKQLLKVRKAIKDKKPDFVQQDYHKKRRLAKRWKRPTGLHSKMRHQKKGYGARVKQGWRSPLEVRGFHGKGIKSVLVHTVSELTQIKNDEGIIIARNVGIKKRLDIIIKAEELKITILNIKPELVKAKVAAMQETKANEKKEKEDKKKKSIEESVKKAEKKEKDKAKAEKITAEVTDDEEEKKKQEKKEKDDVLIHKE